ncbi:ciliary-associated calcium-binding coiled-coil protein 1 isoform X5 [Malaclemys terrapin pileata]|uniref:ciliary-associated calcium-binding coiled-coil protein 1 isoform X5 n=1 Tax=Malaclemys terrapin pileata TaxID=2991368 RepID=UPI0023A824F9|nr:ciliary-associated calcium-binding coiled-coil protein 1 isoform X5 [Malaclemys terrapin pileata]
MAAKAKGKESRKEEGQEQDTVAREIMTWKFLSLPQISALSEQNIEGVQKKLEEFLNFRQIKTSLKEAVLLDYYVSGFWWAKEMDFTHLQLSGFMAILNFLLENLSTKHIMLEDNIKELGRAMAGIGESHSEKGGGLDFFSVDQAKAIISYLKISLFQHYKLYEYLFHNPREELVIGDEEINQECHPEGLQPETESLDIDPMAGFTIEDVKSVLGQITNEIIGSLQTEINEKLQMEEEAYTVRIDKLKNT